MLEEEKEFLILAVKLLFKRIDEGKVKFIKEQVPETIKAVDSVQFDSASNPIFETITAPVRALARAVYMHEVELMEEEEGEREKASLTFPHSLGHRQVEVLGGRW